MPRFFCDAIAGGKAVITGEDAAHIARSLRMQPGERLTLSDGQGTDFDCVLDLVTPQEVFLTVLESYPCRTEPSVYVRLYMAMPKAEKLELIVQKAVELGAAGIVPVSTKNAVVKLDAKKEEAKRKRWQAIAESAAKQSGRSLMPRVMGLMTLGQAFDYIEKEQFALRLAQSGVRVTLRRFLQSPHGFTINRMGEWEQSLAMQAEFLLEHIG